MKAAWAGMQDLMANRAKRLAGAHEIHKFNRDAKELLDRLQVGQWGAGVGWDEGVLCQMAGGGRGSSKEEMWSGPLTVGWCDGAVAISYLEHTLLSLESCCKGVTIFV